MGSLGEVGLATVCIAKAIARFTLLAMVPISGAIPIISSM
jgi:hypothetical protein